MLFFSYKNGYIERKNREKKNLTDEMILEYENDLKNGVDVSSKEYVYNETDYSNNLTKASLKISNKLEHGLNYTIKLIFRKLNSFIND